MSEKLYVSVDDFRRDVARLARDIPAGRYTALYGVPRGGVPVVLELSRHLPNLRVLEQPPVTEAAARTTLVVDDILDSGRTRERFAGSDFAVLHQKASAPGSATYFVHGGVDRWVVYWWEGDREEASVTDNVVRILQYIGEDASREGLRDTPLRVVRSWQQLYSGYRFKPGDVGKLLTVFKDGACDEMVLLRDIEFYSTCEHHMLPFFGRAHIAYIPDGKVVGISKLARLLEVFARRLQIQERLCQQITSSLDTHLQPKGSACILEAQHLCMTGRGVQKQNSIMVTSSLTGVFRTQAATREELLRMVGVKG